MSRTALAMAASWQARRSRTLLPHGSGDRVHGYPRSRRSPARGGVQTMRDVWRATPGTPGRSSCARAGATGCPRTPWPTCGTSVRLANLNLAAVAVWIPQHPPDGRPVRPRRPRPGGRRRLARRRWSSRASSPGDGSAPGTGCGARCASTSGSGRRRSRSSSATARSRSTRASGVPVRKRLSPVSRRPSPTARAGSDASPPCGASRFDAATVHALRVRAHVAVRRDPPRRGHVRR